MSEPEELKDLVVTMLLCKYTHGNNVTVLKACASKMAMRFEHQFTRDVCVSMMLMPNPLDGLNKAIEVLNQCTTTVFATE